MKNKAFITTIIILAFVMSVSGCSSRTPVAVTSDTAATTSIATETNEPTETAAVTTVIDSTMITVPSASGTTAPEQTASVSETTAATSVTTTSAPKETAAPTAAATTKATCAATVKPTTAKPTTAATTKATGTTAETTEQPANPNAGILDPTVPTDPPVGTYSADMAQQVFALVNQARSDAGYPALTWNDTLAAACDIRAKEIVTNFSHARPDGTSEATASDWLSCGENIAKGRSLSAAQAVMDAWMASEGHKNNLLGVTNPYTITAVSCYCVNGVYYWVEEFG